MVSLEPASQPLPIYISPLLSSKRNESRRRCLVDSIVSALAGAASSDRLLFYQAAVRKGFSVRELAHALAH